MTTPRYGVLRVPGLHYTDNVYDFRDCHWVGEPTVSVGACLDRATNLNAEWDAYCMARYTNDPAPSYWDAAQSRALAAGHLDGEMT